MNERPRIRITKGPDITDRETAAAEKLLERPFTEHFDTLPVAVREALKAHELPKTKEERALISFANSETNRLMEEAGITPFEVPAEHCHVLPDAAYQYAFHEEGDASADIDQMAMFVSRKRTATPLLFGKVVLHEMAHLKAHQSFHLHVTEENKLKLSRMRDGLSIHSAPSVPEIHQHFSGLHEAIVATRERMSFPAMLALSEFAKEKHEYYSKETRDLYKAIAEKVERPLDDIAWIEIGDHQSQVTYFTYREHWATLRYICTEIRAAHPDSFETEEQVFKKFENAHYNGKLIELGKLVERTFGTGSFRLIGDMGTDESSAQVCMEALQMRRNEIDSI